MVIVQNPANQLSVSHNLVKRGNFAVFSPKHEIACHVALVKICKSKLRISSGTWTTRVKLIMIGRRSNDKIPVNWKSIPPFADMMMAILTWQHDDDTTIWRPYDNVMIRLEYIPGNIAVNWSSSIPPFVGGGGNRAEMHEKWHRSTLFLQLLPQTEKAQLVTPQTIKYRYRTVTF